MGEVNERGYTRRQALNSVGPGWQEVIKMLMTAKPDETIVVQVKEKFGGLRFYTENAPDNYRRLVRVGESACDYLCETCGKLGETNRGGGWIKNRCPECRAQVEENKK